MSAEIPLLPEDVAEIVSILDDTRYERVDIRSNRFALTIIRTDGGWVQSRTWPDAEADTSVAAVNTTATAELPTSDDQVDNLLTIRAQLPGTFYRAPQPGAPSFIEVGSQVEPNTVVGIIETMKLMTPVHAGVSGIVTTIVVDNAGVVDANAVLARVEPTPK